MFASVLHNPTTLPMLHGLARAQASMATSIQRLSTGLRINSAKDDPAGMIAATHLSSDIVKIQAQQRAAQMDYYKAMVADGSYGAMSDMVRGAGSVLLQSQAGPSSGGVDEGAMQTQMDGILQGIDYLAANISLDGSKLMTGTTTLGSPGTGDDPGTQMTLTRTDTSTLGSLTITDSATHDSTTYTLADLQSGGRLALDGGDDSMSDAQRAELAQKVLDMAVTQLATQRADVGGFMRYTVQSFGNVLDNEEENLTDALSQIQDTDYASEVSNYVRQKALVDSNSAMLAFGAQQSKQVLSLLAPLGT